MGYRPLHYRIGTADGHSVNHIILCFSFFFVTLAVFLTGCSDEFPLDRLSSYDSEKKREANADIILSLGKERVTGCGDFYFQEHLENENIYLVSCINGDGISTERYVVFGNIKKISKF